MENKNVRPPTTGETIGLGAADQGIRPVPAKEGIKAGAANQSVIAAAAI
nr:hypothetical protein [Parasedimentitalea marina]